MDKTGFIWVCNECGAKNFTDTLKEDDLEFLACDSCGCNEFHKEQNETPNMEASRNQQRPQIVTAYWLEYYMADHCTLCGNHGWIDTRGTRTTAGKEVGRVNYCICPNGQILRAGGAELHNMEASRNQQRPQNDK